MIRYQCKQCGAEVTLPDDVAAHSVNWCNCCTVHADHAAAVLPADQCQERNHPGLPCWNPPTQPVRPDGCTVCRPITKFLDIELFGIGVQ